MSDNLMLSVKGFDLAKTTGGPFKIRQVMKTNRNNKTRFDLMTVFVNKPNKLGGEEPNSPGY